MKAKINAHLAKLRSEEQKNTDSESGGNLEISRGGLFKPTKCIFQALPQHYKDLILTKIMRRSQNVQKQDKKAKFGIFLEGFD